MSVWTMAWQKYIKSHILKHFVCLLSTFLLFHWVWNWYFWCFCWTHLNNNKKKEFPFLFQSWGTYCIEMCIKFFLTFQNNALWFVIDDLDLCKCYFFFGVPAFSRFPFTMLSIIFFIIAQMKQAKVVNN